MQKLYMTDDELRRSWRDAADPKNHVQVLAQLNGVNEEAVIVRLHSLGIYPDLSRQRANHLTNYQYQLMNIMYQDGRCDPEIAAEVGVTVSRVRTWRKHAGLPGNKQVHITAEKTVRRARECRPLYERGFNDSQISAMTGYTRVEVRYWRRSEGLPANLGR